MNSMVVVFMAGGKGTRIASIAKDTPKPMIRIEGKPVLEREIECLKKQGFFNFIITVSHLGSVITEYFGDGSKFGVSIKYFYEQEPLGNAGALFKIKDMLSDDFLLLNADIIFDVDFSRFIDFHFKKGGLVSLFTHPNTHPFDSSLIITNSNNSVIKWLSKEDERQGWYKNRVNAGLHVINKKVLDLVPGTDKIDLDRQLLKPLQGTGKMFAYESCEYVRDMGTPERFFSTCADYCKGIVQAKNLKNKQKAIFLDRDGTINKYVGFLTTIYDFELIDGVSEAIKKINNSSFLAIVITNQPVIARGEVTIEELEEIHNKMETLLGIDGAFLDAIYYCPHHPQKGFIGEVPELKIQCDCRKPKPGLIIKAAKDFNIDLSKSWMIGDDENDVVAGESAGCKTIKINRGGGLLEAVNRILQSEV